MKTFEQVYKEKLKEQINKFIDKPVILSNDINTKPLEDNPNELAVIIRTGPGVKSSLSKYDLTTVTFYIDIITVANDVQMVLGAINNLILLHNASWDNVTIPIYDPNEKTTTDTRFSYKPIFSTPFIPGQQFNLRTKSATITAIAITMSVTVGYASNAAVEPSTFKLKINGTEYNLKYERYEITNNPVYEPAAQIGERVLTQRFINNIVTYNFTLLKSAANVDNLHDILSADAMANVDEMLTTKKLQLSLGTKTVDINTYSISEIYQDGATVIVLTLTR